MISDFECSGQSFAELAAAVGISLPFSVSPTLIIRGGASLDTAEPWHVAYMDHPRYKEPLLATRAGVCVVAERFADLVPSSTIAVIAREPHAIYARILARLHPDLMRPAPYFAKVGATAGALVHPTARIGTGVTLDPTVVVGARTIIGSGTMIGAHTVLGPDVVIGQDCSIGANVTMVRCDIGSRTIIHPGACIGQDGFGFAATEKGHAKLPQLGRVLIGNDVEIGANTSIDRGSGRDTLIGNGTKIDNLVQIAHNVRIGIHCIIVAQVGIAGSTILEDFVAVGGQSAIAGHLRIGRGAKLAAGSRVMRDVPSGERWGGMPAKPLRAWFREQTVLKSLTSRASRASLQRGSHGQGEPPRDRDATL